MPQKAVKTKEQVHPVCPECGLKQIYFRIDGSQRCPKCGYDSKRLVK